jgi:hypothetical protein
MWRRAASRRLAGRHADEKNETAMVLGSRARALRRRRAGAPRRATWRGRSRLSDPNNHNIGPEGALVKAPSRGTLLRTPSRACATQITRGAPAYLPGHARRNGQSRPQRLDDRAAGRTFRRCRRAARGTAASPLPCRGTLADLRCDVARFRDGSDIGEDAHFLGRSLVDDRVDRGSLRVQKRGAIRGGNSRAARVESTQEPGVVLRRFVTRFRQQFRFDCASGNPVPDGDTDRGA